MKIIKPRLIGINCGKHLPIQNTLFIASVSIPSYQVGFLNTIGIDYPANLNKLQIEVKANKIMEKFDFWVEEVEMEENDWVNVEDIEIISYFRCYKQLAKQNHLYTYYIYVDDPDISKKKLVRTINHAKLHNDLDFNNWNVEGACNQSVCIAASILASYHYNCY